MKPAIPRSRLALAGVAVAGLALAALASCESDARRTVTSPLPSDSARFTLVPVAGTFSMPVFLTSPPDDASRLFVAELGGTIRVVRNGAKLPTPFLDLSGRITSGGEQGLLGLAFAPDYAGSGRFYVAYTTAAGEDQQLVRYRVSTANPDVADPSSAETLLVIPDDLGNHNGGMLAFGPDGMLYWSQGDGGGANDPHATGQDPSDRLGSILRLDVSGATGYAVPPDNPWPNGAGGDSLAWDYGLRNPWRFSFDRLTGDLYIADVGQGDWEEVNVSTAASGRGKGVNYGWRTTEGTHCFPPGTSGCNTAGIRLPVTEYDHTQGNCIIGGYVYRGSLVPALRGHYFYADNYGPPGTYPPRPWVRSFRFSGGAAADPGSWNLPSGSGGPLSFGEDANGELYLLTSAGKVYQFQP